VSFPPSSDAEDAAVVRVLTGATAVGKTAAALALAERLGLELVSMDSMLVDRGMDVGTAKPTRAERERVPHHGIDVVEPHETYDVRRWLTDATHSAAEVERRGKRVLYVGGTGLYLQALVRGIFEGPPPSPAIRAALEERVRSEGSPALHVELSARDAASAARIHPNDAKRVVRALEVLEGTGRPLSAWQAEWGWHGERRPERPHRVVGLALPQDELDAVIATRTRAMLDGGWPGEVQRILAGSGFSSSSIQALGYPEVVALVEGRATRAETEAKIAQRTRRFARRQRTWFQRFPDTLWLDPRHPSTPVKLESHLF